MYIHSYHGQQWANRILVLNWENLKSPPGNGRLGTHHDSSLLVVGILHFVKYLLSRQLPSTQNSRNPFHSVRRAIKSILTANNLGFIESRVRWNP